MDNDDYGFDGNDMDSDDNEMDNDVYMVAIM